VGKSLVSCFLTDGVRCTSLLLRASVVVAAALRSRNVWLGAGTDGLDGSWSLATMTSLISIEDTAATSLRASPRGELPGGHTTPMLPIVCLRLIFKAKSTVNTSQNRKLFYSAYWQYSVCLFVVFPFYCCNCILTLTNKRMCTKTYSFKGKK